MYCDYLIMYGKGQVENKEVADLVALLPAESQQPGL